MRRDVAEKVHPVLLDAYERVNATYEDVRGTCSAEEFKVYARGVGQAMADLLDLLNPIWRDYPDLLPDAYVSPTPNDQRDRMVVRALHDVRRVVAIYALRPRVEDMDYFIEVPPWPEGGLVPDVRQPLVDAFGVESLPDCYCHDADKPYAPMRAGGLRIFRRPRP